MQSEQACALGASIFGAVAAGKFSNVPEAMEIMGSDFETVYDPEVTKVESYEEVYKKYSALAEVMEPHIMKQAEK